MEKAQRQQQGNSFDEFDEHKLSRFSGGGRPAMAGSASSPAKRHYSARRLASGAPPQSVRTGPQRPSSESDETTVQYSPSRLASDIACTSSALLTVPFQSAPEKAKQPSATSSVPMNALFRCLAMTCSPAMGTVSGLNACPAWPGR